MLLLPPSSLILTLKKNITKEQLALPALNWMVRFRINSHVLQADLSCFGRTFWWHGKRAIEIFSEWYINFKDLRYKRGYQIAN
jgi:hypothetical protein